MAASLWGFASLSAASPLWLVIVIHMVLMAGLGLMMTPLMTSSLAVLPGPLYSHGSAILATLQQVAGAFGTAAFVTISAIASTTAGGSPDAQGLRTGFMAAGVVGVLALIVSFFLPRRIVAAPDADASDAGTTDMGRAEVETAADAPEVDPRAGAASAVEPGDTPARATDTGPVPVAAGTPNGSGHGAKVVGQVTLARGGEAVVTLVDEHGVQHGRAETSDGSYDLALPGSGAWLVVISAPGHAPRADRVVAGGHAPELRHDVTLLGTEPIADDARAPERLTSQS
jgi:MFS transporter, DHA2 family, lincomycin resistance protein